MSGYQPLFTAADQFIALANELAQQDRSGTVGAALRYAAARYSAFEASTGNADLSVVRAQTVAAVVEDFRKMLEHNVDDYQRRLGTGR
ncbi:MAG: DUF3144 domain-containing protein [Rhodocyclaceae bacterium]|nr:DUF3144 domain-containing protein [Rhodocyclaceae bacterium]